MEFQAMDCETLRETAAVRLADDPHDSMGLYMLGLADLMEGNLGDAMVSWINSAIFADDGLAAELLPEMTEELWNHIDACVRGDGEESILGLSMLSIAFGERGLYKEYADDLCVVLLGRLRDSAGSCGSAAEMEALHRFMEDLTVELIITYPNAMSMHGHCLMIIEETLKMMDMVDGMFPGEDGVLLQNFMLNGSEFFLALSDALEPGIDARSDEELIRIAEAWQEYGVVSGINSLIEARFANLDAMFLDGEELDRTVAMRDERIKAFVDGYFSPPDM